MRSPERLILPIVLSRSTERPLHEQLIDALRQAIGDGLLPAGSRLPSTRTLAGLLGVSRGVAITAYQRLYADGAINGASGSGTYVSEPGPAAPTVHTGQSEPVERVDLRPGQPCAEGFPLAAWRAAWRQASYRPPPPDLPPGAGLPELRSAIADHVRRVHGYTGPDHRIVITSGPRHGLRVLLRALAPKLTGAALADPGPPWLPDAVAAHGLPRAWVPLDDNGFRVDRVPAGANLVLVAPEGDAPIGVRTSGERRAELAGWAERTGGWLVAIGHDTTTEPGARPLPSLLALGPRRRTAVLGDLGALLTPAMRIGYLVLPAALARIAEEQLAAAEEQPALLCQRAAAELFRSGSVARRENQLATAHAGKLAVVREILGPNVLDARIPGTATVLLPNGVAAGRVVDRCARAGIRLTPLLDSYAAPDTAPSGLLLGFGQLTEAALRTALHTIAVTVHTCRSL